MMRHLAGLGHTRIAFIRGPDTNVDARERLRGYRHGMRTIGPSAGLVLEGDFTEAGGYAAAQALFQLDPLPTAAFFANDSMAVGALSAFAERGLTAPDSMSVVGFDDIRISRFLAPPLTTIAVDSAELGRRAFALLRDGMAAPRHSPHQERIAARLVVRRSCGAPPERRVSSGKRRKKV
jgi:LacI family transcriptional regulator